MIKQGLYKDFAKYYDLVYSKKKYQKEVDFIDRILKKHTKGKKILDIACGTGNHAKLFQKKGYNVIGIDKNKEMLKIARRKVRKATFKEGDMGVFNLNRKFDAVLCMFTAINYNTSFRGLEKTLSNFKRHLDRKGIIVFDFPLPGTTWKLKSIFNHAIFLGKDAVVLYTNKDIKSLREILIYWIIKKGKKAEVFEDSHTIRFYSLKEFEQVLKQIGLKHKVYWDFSLSKKKGRRPVIVCWQE